MARTATKATKRFVVAKTNIFTSEGKFGVGDKVDLTPAEAKHFNDLGYLAPDLDDFVVEEDIGGEDEVADG